MKKIVSIIGVVAIALTLFINSNTTNSQTDISLANLTTLSTANAEWGECDEASPWGPYTNYADIFYEFCYDNNNTQCGMSTTCIDALTERCVGYTCYLVI